MPYVVRISIIAVLLLVPSAAVHRVGATVSTTPQLQARVTVERIEPKKPVAPAVAPAAAKSTSVAKRTSSKTSTVKNHIVIPRMGVDTDILEGKTTATLNKGIWHLPGSSSPDKGGNIVISGHRYKWLPPSTKTFWNMDKMVAGDQIDITWNGTKYTYVVKEIKVVTPDKVEILDNTPDHRLTLFTCTPKFTSKYRLVVIAYPIESTH